MIRIYKSNGKAYSQQISPDGNSKSGRRMEISDAEALVDSGEAILYDTHDDLNAAVEYEENRRNKYPAIEEQLDQIFHKVLKQLKMHTQNQNDRI